MVLYEHQVMENKGVKENSVGHLVDHLVLLRDKPQLMQALKAWQQMPEDIKNAIRSLAQRAKHENI